MKSKFKAHLQGHQFDLERVKRLYEPVGYVIDKADDGNWYISGGEIDACSTVKDVRTLVGQIVDDANSVLTLADSDYRQIRASATVIDNENHIHCVMTMDHIELRMNAKGSVIEASGQPKPLEPPYEHQRKWIEVGKLDADAKAILDLFSRDVDHKHYRAYERVQRTLGSNTAVRKLTGWTKPEQNAVTQPLNDARHETTTPSAEALDSARRKVDELVGKWLDHRADDLLPGE